MHISLIFKLSLELECIEFFNSFQSYIFYKRNSTKLLNMFLYLDTIYRFKKCIIFSYNSVSFYSTYMK